MFDFIGTKRWQHFYGMDVRDDTFVHFTPQSRADQIVADNRLKMNPPYPKFGIDSVNAVSLRYGKFKPNVQTTHTRTTPDDPIVAVVFKTNVIPDGANFIEEVYWHEDVIFTRVAIYPVSKARGWLNRNNPPQVPSDDEYVILYEGSPAYRRAKQQFKGKQAKYKNKKTVKDQDGKDMVVYEYSDRQVNKRHKEKSKKVEKIRTMIGDLESQVKKDLKSKEKQQVALAVALINHTYERVGNDESASNGHYGVTGWKKKHLSFKGGKAVLSYTGKSGVRHTKEVDDKTLVSALRERSKGLSPEDNLLSDVKAPDVNEYLNQFGITAKDIRGYHANREMQERLKALRQENGELPKDKKEREQTLKDEFKEALKGAAKAVGHEEATLRGQYLVPHLEETYMKDGTVITTLKKAQLSRIATRIFGTKTDAEKSDEEAERLVSKSPKKKPPRNDKDRRRVKIDDKDIDKDPDMTSKDTSMNYKVIGGSLGGIVTRVASMYLMASRVADRYQMAQRVANRWASTEITEEPKKEKKDEKQKEKDKQSLLRRKESEAWKQFTKEKITDPETKKDVSWATFEKKNPDQAKKIREKFRSDFAEQFSENEAKQENTQDKALNKKLRDEEKAKLDEQASNLEKVDLAGREVIVPLDAPDSVRSVVFALEEGKKDTETVEEYNARKKTEILDRVRGMSTEDLQQLWDTGVLDTSDPRVNEAMETILNLPAMSDVVGRPMSKIEAKMLEDYYSALTTETVSMTYFNSDKEETKGFLAGFLEGAKDKAIAALQGGKDPDLNKVMSDYMKTVTTDYEKKQTRIRELTLNDQDDSDKEKFKELEKTREEVESMRAETQKLMDSYNELEAKLNSSDTTEEAKEDIRWEMQSTKSQMEKAKSKLSEAHSVFTEKKNSTKPSQEAIKEALIRNVDSLPTKTQADKDFKKQMKDKMVEDGFDYESALLEIGDRPQKKKTERYTEMITHYGESASELSEMKDKMKDPDFDLDAELDKLEEQARKDYISAIEKKKSDMSEKEYEEAMAKANDPEFDVIQALKGMSK